MKNKLSLQNIPTPLFHRAGIYLVIAIGILLVAIAFSIAEHDPKCLLIALATVYFSFLGLSIIVRWNTGKIKELAAYCSSVTISPIVKSNCTVIFTLEDDDAAASSLTISIPAKGCPYVQNIAYVLYIDAGNPSQILASYPVS